MHPSSGESYNLDEELTATYGSAYHRTYSTADFAQPLPTVCMRASRMHARHSNACAPLECMRATRMRGGVPPSASDCAPHQVRVPLEEYSGEVQSRATWPTHVPGWWDPDMQPIRRQVTCNPECPNACKHVPGWWDPDMQPIRRQVKRKPLAICSQSARNLLAICSGRCPADLNAANLGIWDAGDGSLMACDGL